MHQAKTHFSKLLEDVGRGEEILIAKSGKPCARLVPLDPPATSVPLGFLQGEVPDSFFEPLPDDELSLWEGV